MFSRATAPAGTAPDRAPTRSSTTPHVMTCSPPMSGMSVKTSSRAEKWRLSGWWLGGWATGWPGARTTGPGGRYRWSGDREVQQGQLPAGDRAARDGPDPPRTVGDVETLGSRV